MRRRGGHRLADVCAAQSAPLLRRRPCRHRSMPRSKAHLTSFATCLSGKCLSPCQLGQGCQTAAKNPQLRAHPANQYRSWFPKGIGDACTRARTGDLLGLPPRQSVWRVGSSIQHRFGGPVTIVDMRVSNQLHGAEADCRGDSRSHEWNIFRDRNRRDAHPDPA